VCVWLSAREGGRGFEEREGGSSREVVLLSVRRVVESGGDVFGFEGLGYSHSLLLARLRLSFIYCAALVVLAWGVSPCGAFAVEAGFFSGNVRVLIVKGGLKGVAFMN
jgi:hypothetical protein